MAALAQGRSRLSNILLAEDTHVMIQGLDLLGFDLKCDPQRKYIEITGQGGRIPRTSAELFCGNSGTTIRFLTAMCSLGKGEFILDGVARMRKRPIGELIEMLHHLGVRTEYLQDAGCPPVKVIAHGLPGGTIYSGSAQSSQFLSAVLMVSPFARHELRVELNGPQTSWPYAAMTMQLMDQFYLTPELIRDPITGEPIRIIIPQGTYRGADLVIEPDGTNASYFLATAAIHPNSTITINGLGARSLQGDVQFANVLKRMGAHVQMKPESITVTGTDQFHGIDVDLSSMPDTAQTLAVAALFAHGTTTIHGLHTLRVKETDRLSALSNELTRLGAAVQIDGDSLKIEPPSQIRPGEVETYEDHRMAMSFSLAATRASGVTIKDGHCVAKTYPGFFEDLRKALSAGEQLVLPFHESI